MPSLIDEHTQFEADGLPIVSGKVYIGTQGLDPVANTITIYSDRDLTVAISNPQATDANGRTTNKIWVPGKYSIQVDDSADVQKYQELDAGDTVQIGLSILTNVAGTDTITAEGSPVITSLTDGQQYNFTAANTNTGAATLQIDLTAAKTIKKNHDQDLVAGDIEQNQIVAVIYNSTDDTFEKISNVSTAAGIVIDETADHTATPTAGKGEYWVKDDTPNIPKYTDDAGSDFDIAIMTSGEIQVTLVPSTSGSITIAAALDTLAWRKIGDLCHVQGQLQVASVSSPTGTAVEVTSLPFPVGTLTENAGNSTVPVMHIGLSGTSDGFKPGQVTGGTTILRIIGFDYGAANPVIGNLADKYVGGVVVDINFWYITA